MNTENQRRLVEAQHQSYLDGLHGVAVYQFKDNLIYRMSFAL